MVDLTFSPTSRPSLWTLAVRFASDAWRSFRNRREARALLNMSARELSDIGLTRTDVQLAFGGSLLDDPTERLSAWAMERRSAFAAQARERRRAEERAGACRTV